MVKRKLNAVFMFLSSLLLLISIPVVHFSIAENHRDTGLFSQIPMNVNEYGLNSDSLISSVVLRKEGESLDLLLKNLGVDEKLRMQIISVSNSSLSEFTSGDIYRAYWNISDPNKIKYIVFEKDPINYSILELNSSVKIYEGKKEFAIKRKLIEGEIKSSFYHSLGKNDLHPELISRLSEIYQWQVDFHNLRKGDNFKFIIEEKFAGDSLVGVPKIAGAYFKHRGIEFYAIRYNDGRSPEYYDLSGRKVKREFLNAPVDYSTITSPYSDSRFHPILKVHKPHLGTDYAAPAGTPVHSVANGVIAEARFSKGNGNYIRIIHDNIYSTQYLHLSHFAKGILPGKRVKQGDIIGYVGSTGLATGPHLCFRFWKNGIQVNPMEETFPTNTKLRGEKLKTFIAWRDTILNELERFRPEFASNIN